jgi:hypothetical protein
MDELVSRSGARGVHVVGLRLGAALAVRAAQRGASRPARPIEALWLWDPLLSGEEFLDQARAFQNLFLRDRGRFSAATIRNRAAAASGDYLVGHAFSEVARSSLEALDLRAAEAWPSLPIRAVLTDPSPQWEGVAARLRSAGRAVTTEVVKGAPGAWDDYVQHEKTLRAGPVSAQIVEELGGSRA